MRAAVIRVDVFDILFLVICMIALASFITMLVCVIKLIIAKKEKRRAVKKVKIAAVISAIIAAVIASAAIVILPPPPLPPIVEKMPDLIGLTYEECKENYSDKFEIVVEEEEYSFEYPKGKIISQYPFEGAEYLVGRTTVKCIRSRGPRMVAVSNVIGLDFEDAKEILGEYDKFTVGFVSEYSDDVPKGKVIATDPPAGEKAVYGSAVKVTVSGGKEPEITNDNE